MQDKDLYVIALQITYIGQRMLAQLLHHFRFGEIQWWRVPFWLDKD